MSSELLPRLRRQLAPYEADEQLAASFRAKQLHAMLRLTPLAMLVNLFNASFVMYRLAAQSPWLWAWLLALLLIACQGVAAWYRARRRSARQTASPHAMQRAVRHALILGTLWGLLPALLLSNVAVQDQQMLITISCGMICAGGFALVTVPTAAIAYVLAMTLGSVAGLLRTSLPGAEILLYLLMIYSLVVLASVQTMARSYGLRLVAEADAAHKEQIVGLLLRDFEENSSDFLWELTTSGRLTHASERLKRALQFDPQHDVELGLTTLIGRTHRASTTAPPDASIYLGQLQKALTSTSPFRDLLVPVVIGGTLRWWALTAKPLRQGGDGDGAQGAPGWRGVGADVTDRKRAEDEMHRLAHFDALTGLANRRHFQHRLQQLCANDGSAALLCIDMDNFKRVNDAYGHANGDLLLKTVAQRMTSTIRSRDLVARLGGDEFAILLDGVDEVEEASGFAARLMQAIELPCDLAGISFTPHTSMGIAYLPRDGREPDTILHHADLALFEAKARGGRQAQFFSIAMDEKAQRRIDLEDGLRQALSQNAMHLVYQPQIALQTNQVTGVEALLRWSSPCFGEVSPAEFIPVAEEAGLISDIGLWVLETACAAACHLPPGLLVAVNLSACQFDDDLLVDKILEVLARSTLPAQRLELEITESVFLRDTDDVLTALHRLRAAGVRIALDDFGTGYSSLAYLRSFPFHKLKIDRTFVMTVHENPESEAIVRSVIHLAGALRMETTAEGIETAEQAALLTQLGCTNGQGYHFARPLRMEAVQAFATQRLLPVAQEPMTD